MAKPVSARLTPSEGRRFGFTLGAAFLALAAVAWWRGRETAGIGFAGLGTALLLAGLLMPTALGPVERAWLGFGRLLSKVTTPVFLGIVFYLVVTPVALLMRVLGRAPLRAPAPGTSAWIPRAPEARRRRDLERQF